MTPNIVDERFHRGIQEFNRGNYFEAHEVLEDFWHEYREFDRTFIQGLIQTAAAFYHQQCQNWKGASSQLTKASQKLHPYAPHHQGIELQQLLQGLQECLRQIEDVQSGKGVSVDEISIPKIILQNSAIHPQPVS